MHLAEGNWALGTSEPPVTPETRLMVLGPQGWDPWSVGRALAAFLMVGCGHLQAVPWLRESRPGGRCLGGLGIQGCAPPPPPASIDDVAEAQWPVGPWPTGWTLEPLSLPRWVHARPPVLVSLEKPLGFQAGWETRTRGSSLPLFKREKGCAFNGGAALGPAIVAAAGT